MANVPLTSEVNGAILTAHKFMQSTAPCFITSFISIMDENVNLCKSAFKKVEGLNEKHR